MAAQRAALPAPPGIFISYRRRDAAFPAGWLYESLSDHFGRSQVFKDVDSIQPGEDFVEVITQAVSACHTMLVVIGPKWLALLEEAPQDDESVDFVQLEVESAIAHGLRLIPILVEDASMPTTRELPESIAALARHNAIRLSPNHFDAGLRRLVPVVEEARDAAVQRQKVEAEADGHPEDQRARLAVEQRVANTRVDERQSDAMAGSSPTTDRVASAPKPVNAPSYSPPSYQPGTTSAGSATRSTGNGSHLSPPTAAKPKVRRSSWPRHRSARVAIAAAVVGTGVAAFVVWSPGASSTGATNGPTAESGASVLLAPIVDKGGSVQLVWTGPDLDYGVEVSRIGGQSDTVLAGRVNTVGVAVEPGSQYCFRVTGSDGGTPITSNVQPVRGARCPSG